MIIKKYEPTYCKELIQLFYDTVHTINAKDYSKKQLNAWATKNTDPEKWNHSLTEHYTIVAIEDEIIVGFGDIDQTGYIDRLFVHKNYQRQGVATAICDQLEQTAKGKVYTHASITAKPFFEKRGYKVIKKQEIKKQNIVLINFIMEKSR